MPSFPEIKGKFVYRALLVFLSAIFSYIAISSVLLDSATDDEPVHIAAGYIKTTTGHFDYYREAPPLLDSIIALPLLIRNYDFPPVWKYIPNQWDAGHTLLYRTGHDPDAILFLARLPVIFLFLLLCYLVSLWVFSVTGNRLFSLLGFVLTGFCPNLLAHGRLATADLGVTFFITLTAFLFFRFLYTPNWVNTLLTGISLGLTFLSKVSGLILLAYLPVMLAFFMILEKRFSGKDMVHYVSRVSMIVMISLISVGILYFLQMSDSYILLHYPESADSIIGKLAVPFKEYMKNVSSVYRWVSESYDKPQFLLGSFSLTGWWYYYIVAFLLKTPIPMILLFICSIVAVVAISPVCWKSNNPNEKQYFFHILAPALFISLFFAVSFTSKLNIGIRYILPIYPFLILFVTLSVARFFTSSEKPGIMLHIALCVLVFWTVSSGIAAYPSYISYFNEIAWNETDKDKYLIDSNLDWGQDLKRLAIWVNENHIPVIHVAYFGGGEPTYYIGSKAVPFPSEKKKGYYAISRTTYRTSSFYKDSLREDFEGFFKNAKHMATIGGSIYVFKIE